jgi:uncharacterized membrane protein
MHEIPTDGAAPPPAMTGAAVDAPGDAAAADAAHIDAARRAVDAQWGSNPDDNFGYASDEERLAKRGMEDWELVTKIPASQRRVPYWFIAVVVIVLLVAMGLGFPFWGQRPGVKVQWFNWGYVGAIFYVAVAAGFVYFMTNLYGSERAGRLDDDPENAEARAAADAGDPSRRSD